jgi:hypothetical protein
MPFSMRSIVAILRLPEIAFCHRIVVLREAPFAALFASHHNEMNGSKAGPSLSLRGPMVGSRASILNRQKWAATKSGKTSRTRRPSLLAELIQAQRNFRGGRIFKSGRLLLVPGVPA